MTFVITVFVGVLGSLLWAPPTSAADDASQPCQGNVAPAPVTSRQINLVIDDSGSMFAQGSKPLTRWAFAKYSLEVFAAMMGEADSLTVYRTSDFGEKGNTQPAAQLSGTQTPSERTQQIHGMAMSGGGTPYATVQTAYRDLMASDAEEKWLVILTDGKFEGQAASKLPSDLRVFVKEKNLHVALMGIGDKAESIPNDPEHGIYFAKAATSDDLLTKMTGFANRIFGRAHYSSDSTGAWSPDIDMEQILVFAQGDNVSLGDAKTSNGSVGPTSVVDVMWSDNADVEYDGRMVPAVPDETLEGKLATYEGVTAGPIAFDVANQKTTDIFYAPQVNFGVLVKDAQGNSVAPGKIMGGDYIIEYGFMNDKCELITSELLGDVSYSATISQDGKIVASDFASGDSVTLERGDVTMDVAATYLNGNTARAQIPFKVLQPAVPAELQAGQGRYLASELGDFQPDAHALEFVYFITENGVDRAPTSEEWASVDPTTLAARSDSNLEFEVVKGDKPGQLFLKTRAPGGDVYAADTGTIDVTVTAERIFDEQKTVTSASAPIDVVDDISGWDRAMHWFKTIGWKLLLALLALILLCGYLFKRRFSKRMKRRPGIAGTPRQVGRSAEESTGKFNRNSLRHWLPFVADTATLTYVPSGVSGFRAMKLKAGPRKSMVLVNWKQIAEKDNTEINGTPLNEETRRAPSFGPSATISASTPQMTYEMTPNA